MLAINEHTLNEHTLTAIRNQLTTGRIAEIVDVTAKVTGQDPMLLSAADKVALLSDITQLAPGALDSIIADHSQAMRTVKGHTFEVVFDGLLRRNGVSVTAVGGDTDIDRIVGGQKLQLKTPYVAGCTDLEMAYKTHRTHGPKSAAESIDYYHRVDEFADYLVGLVAYNPLRVLIVPREDLPRVPDHEDYIQSPLLLDATDSRYLNRWDRLGLGSITSSDQLADSVDDVLPRTAGWLGAPSDCVLNSIFDSKNFRAWDMNIRGFVREFALFHLLGDNGVHVYAPTIAGKPRSDKSDLALRVGDNYQRYQVKGLTWRGCRLAGDKTRVDVETQLSRGRVNDHPTQSRLYLATDFEGVIVAVDPPYANTLSLAATGQPDYHWRFYAVPTDQLVRHKTYTRRIASHQYIQYNDLQKYAIDAAWMSQWSKED